MNLAIEGHPKRGNEVIERLEMLGGINKLDLKGIGDYSYYYIDDSSNNIYCVLSVDPNDYIIYTLEEFLEKFPYKVGNKVQHKGATSCGSIFEVEEMRWEENTIKYTLCLFGCNYKRSTLPVEYLQPYKEETMEEKENSVVVNIEHRQLKVHSLRFDKTQLVINDEYELKQEGDAYYIVRKEIQYPKTYVECFNICFGKKHHIIQVVGLDGLGDNKELFESFIKLKICRDAYWKIAGEQMGLGKPWKQNYYDRCFIISNNNDNIRIYEYHGDGNVILAFPTEEMRDAFYENFKELIETCKELL